MLPLLKLLSFYPEYELEDARLAMDRIRANLAGSSRADAARWCDAALAALREAQEAEIGLVVQPDTSAARREEAETRVDAASRTLHRRLDQEASYVGMSPDAEAAAALRTLGWPEGVRRIVTSSYAEKAAMGERLAVILADPQHAGLLARLHLTGTAAAHGVAIADFAAALRDDGRAARAAATAAATAAADRALSLVVQAIAGVFTAFDQASPAEVAERQRVMAPWVALNDALHARYTAKRAASRPAACAGPMGAHDPAAGAGFADTPTGLANAAK